MRRSILFVFSALMLIGCQDEVSTSQIESINGENAKAAIIEMEKAKAVALKFANDLTSITRGTQAKEVEDVFAWLKDDVGPFIKSPRDTDKYDRLPLRKLLCYLLNNPTRPEQEAQDVDNPSRSGSVPPVSPYDPRIYRIDSIIPPLLTTKWGQVAPFNTYCFTASGEQALAGCVAVAAAQVAAFHQHPASYDGYVYSWSEILSGASPTSSIGQQGAAHLVHDLGVLVNTVYGTEGSSAYMSGLLSGWQAMGYHRTFSYYNYDACMQHFSNGLPVIISGGDHCWVVDGGLLRNRYAQVLNFNGTYQEVLLSTQKMIHCNWGWNGGFNGYFLFDSFQDKFLNDDLTGYTGTNPDHSYTDEDGNLVFYQVYPLN